MKGLLNALIIHASRILPENQVSFFILTPMLLAVIGSLLYIGWFFKDIPVIGYIFYFIGFAGSVWVILATLFFTYLGWLWLLLFSYLVLLSVWLINKTNKYDSDLYGYNSGFDLGQSYNLKRFISLIIASAFCIYFGKYILVSFVELFQFYDTWFGKNDFGKRVWVPWDYLF